MYLPGDSVTLRLQKQFNCMESPTKTGIIYDPLMLLHTCDGYHTEKAIRASSIIRHLKGKHYLEHPKIDFVDKIEEAPFEVIELVHSKEYIERVGKLLDE
jgi:acetoin utilization deacetylase AcuC-like enzyme